MNATQEHKDYVRERLLPIYNDPRTGFKGRDALYNQIKHQNLRISRRDVAHFLANLEAHQLHLIRKRDKVIRNIIAKAPNRHWQIDLVDMQKLSRDNGGIRYILTVIDVYSRYLWAVGLRDKTQLLVRGAIQPLINQYRPRVVQSDNGPEFADIIPEDLHMEVHQIKSAAYTPESNGLVERVNATLKRKLYAYMTQNATRRYVDVLQQIVRGYNTSKHVATKHKPIALFTGVERYQPRNTANPHQWPLLQRGDKVRISELLNPQWKKNLFVKKHYLPRWTVQLYTIKTRSPDGMWYTLEETGRKRYKAQDLQYVDEDEMTHTFRNRAVEFDEPAVEHDRDAPNIPVAPAVPVAERRGRRGHAGVNPNLQDYWQ